MLAARRTALRTLLVTLVALLALAGTAGAAATGPQVQLADADQAWAQSVLLATSDLGPGWRSLSGSDESEPTAATASALCPGFNPSEADLVLTGGSSSGGFARGENFVASSGSTVWQTPEHAQADWDRLAQPQLLSCLSAALSAGSTKQLKIVIRSKKQLPFDSVAPRTAAYRIAFAFQMSRKVKGKVRKTSLPATIDLVLVGNGRATSLLIFVALSKPLTATFEQSVAQLVAQRLAKDPTASS